MSEKDCDQLIDKLFNNLDSWRHLPTYQLERRAEIFFSFYFEEILGVQKNELTVIPEFPLPLAMVGEDFGPDNQQTCKVDYMILTNGKVIFLEIKTDETSRVGKMVKNLAEGRDENIGQQLHRMLMARKLGIVALLEKLGTIHAKNRTHRAKWKCLFERLHELGWLQPNGRSWITGLSKNIDIEIIYIQPKATEEVHGIKVIDFDRVISAIEHYKDPFTQRFITSLREWKVPSGCVSVSPLRIY
jgi:hypothetical protein